ncbi:uncharacterized protein LOC143285156 [Babylonia areolata]|uniref:uncharacterized protein LOC143285156 n=1 Tax=Babylonia areolata TaxID=304850 RepID=UPI003FD1C2B2
MQMYHKFMIMITMTTVSLLIIFSHLDWHRERTEALALTADYLEKNSSTPSPQRDTVTRVLESENNATKSGKPAASNKQHEKPQKTASKAGKPQEQENEKWSKKGQTSKSTKAPEEEIDPELEKAEVTFPDWFTKGWSRTATAGQKDVFVGDRPLFPACNSASGGGAAKYSFIEPKKYLHNSKNPCWYDDTAAGGARREKALRCIPYFYVAGVAKCGTTDLYRRLRLHSQVMKGTMKEYHFWDRERFGNVELSQNGEIAKTHRKPWTFKQYTEAVVGERDMALLKDDLKYAGSSSKIFGDGSPSYLWDILNWKLLSGNQGCKEPRVIIGQHIRHVYPAARIILIFRHPTPRLYSRFLSRIWRTSYLKGADAQTFHDFVVKGVQMYRDCFKRWSIRHCAFNYTLYDDVVIRLVEGMYPVFMADWLRIWPKEQMLLLRNEDYGQNLTKTLETAFDFLGVGSPSEEDREAIVAQSKVNVGAEYDKVGPMKPETARILDEFYQPFVDQLAHMLNDPRFLWRDVYTPSHLGSADTTKNGEVGGGGTASTAGGERPGGQNVTRLPAGSSPQLSAAAAAAEPVSSGASRGGTGTGVTDKPLPLWAKLLMQFKPSSDASSNKVTPQSEEVPIMRIEKPPGTPIKKARYPGWWVNGWPKSSTSGLADQFLGDQPFFAPCSSRSQGNKAFDMIEPRKYEAALKNPCWYRDPQARDSLRCLPYFYVAGVAKSGTSDLYRRLSHHPDILQGSMKEYHWWDRGRFGDFYSDDLPIKAPKPEGIRIPFKQYADMITGRQGITSLLDDVRNTGKSVRVFGDISPSYFNDVKFWPLLDGNQGCSEPRVTIGQHIRHMTPSAKIIVIVRHPTPRLYLRFLARVPEKVSVRKAASFAFHRLVKKSVNMYKACFDHWSVRHCAYNTTLYQKDKVKLWEGMYSVFLWDWLRVFPRQQIYVTRYRDLIRDTRTVMTQIFNFLDLPALNETMLRSLVGEKWLERREEHELKKYFGPMVPETVDMLNDFYEPFVDKFAETLNDERFLWRDSDHL